MNEHERRNNISRQISVLVKYFISECTSDTPSEYYTVYFRLFLQTVRINCTLILNETLATPLLLIICYVNYNLEFLPSSKKQKQKKV